MYKKGRVNSNSRIISTDEDPSLRIESSAMINLRGVSTKLNKYNLGPVNLGRNYIDCQENISTGQIILFCSYGEVLSRLPGKVSRCDVVL